MTCFICGKDTETIPTVKDGEIVRVCEKHRGVKGHALSTVSELAKLAFQEQK